MPSYITAKGVELSTSKTPNGWPTATSAAETQTGSAKNDIFHGAGGDTLVGGLGDDTYTLWDANETIVEKAGEGIDTVDSRYWGEVTLGANVENLFLNSAGSIAGTGNALSNIIVAGTVGATLNGKGGDDVLVGGAGADFFKVAAGNGSDAILNFKPSSDVIQLQGYGITSFTTLKTMMTQTGSDVTINMSNGESLVIRGVDLNDLSAYDFALKPGASTQIAGMTELAGAGKAYSANGWYVINNAWNVDGLTYGKDYAMSSAYNPSDLTAKTQFNWSFPVVTDWTTTIRAYPEVAFGPAPMSGGAKVTDTAGVFPIKVSDLSNLVAEYDVSYKGNMDGFNVAFDIWLTDTPGGGVASTTNEIMVWVHKGGLTPFGKQVGTYTDGDITGKIYVSTTGDWTYTAIVLDTDRPKGTLDIDNILTKLKSMGIVSANEYVASVELGAEVASGAGQLTINNLDLTVEALGSGGISKVMSVTGSGTTTSVLKNLAASESTNAVVVAPDISGDDRVTYSTSAATLEGGAGHDTLVLNTNAVVQLGATGSQVSGTTYVTGFESVDASGSTLTVSLTGSADANKLTGGSAADSLLGGAGNDTLDGGGGSDVVRGEAGDDRIVYDAGDSIIDGGAGNDVLVLKGATTVELGNFSSTQIVGGAYVTGFESVDASGASAAVTVNGSQYNNTIIGSAYADTIKGGAGYDLLTGGAGADIFVFEGFTAGDVDTITDFSRTANDKIDLSLVDAIAGGTDDPFVYIGTSAFHGVAGELRYVVTSSGVTVQADVNGDSVADFSIAVNGMTSMLQTDFML